MATTLRFVPSQRPLLDAFVGRDDEQRTLAEQLARGARLVVLTGGPGVGKSRFAREFAEHVAARDPATRLVALCDLTDARDTDDACALLAQALDAAPGASAEALGAALARAGRALVLLDHAEPLGDRAAPLVLALLAAAPEARVVVTTRTRLACAGAWVHELAPLAVPREGGDAAARSPAVRLLADRIARVARGAGAADPEVLAEIARRLEGIPLAIELAATRASVLDPVALLERLPRRLDLLDPPDGARAGPAPAPRTHARGATLRGAVAWSWQQLAPAEQLALAQCAVFRGGFTVDAAEATLELSAAAPDARVIDAMQSLRDHSLLHLRHAADDDGGAARTRFDLYLPVREFAGAQLAAAEPGARVAVRERHAWYFVREGERRAHGAEEGRSAVDLRWLVDECENLLCATEWLLERAAGDDAGDPARHAEGAARALLALQVPRTRRPLAWYLALLGRALALPALAAAPAGVRAEVLRARGNALRHAGQLAAAQQGLAAACVEAERAGDARREGRARTDLGTTLAAAGRAAEAADAFARALALHRAAGDARYAVTASTFLAFLELDAGRAARARAYLTEALDAARDVGDPRRQTTCLYCLGLAWHDERAFDRARDLYEQAAELAQAQHDRPHEGIARLMLGVLALELGDPAAARAALETASRCLHEIDPSADALGRAYLAVAQARQGLAAEARATFDAARVALHAMDAPIYRAAVELLEGAVELAEARVALDAGNAPRAARLCAAARARCEAPPRVAAPPGAEAIEPLDARVARRVLAAGLAAPDARAPPAAASALRVARDGAWFELRGCASVSLAQHETARRLLRALAEQRVARPGEPIAHHALISAGWPGQRILAEAAALRLRAAIAQLRRLGLRDVLITRPGGYVLSPAVPVELAAPERDRRRG